MLNTILGTKSKMSQTFLENRRVPVTVVKAGPCIVTQINENSIQLGLDTKKAKHTTKPLRGHFNKIKFQDTKNKKQTYPRYLKEVKKDEEEYNIGQLINITDIFTVGDTIQVTGTSKGKGFQGGVKRHGFSGGPKTHGQSDRHRAPGAIGQGTTPGRVWPGKRMAGRMGSDTITIKNLKVVNVDSENNELHISGPVPGTVGTLLIIKRLSPKQEISHPDVDQDRQVNDSETSSE